MKINKNKRSKDNYKERLSFAIVAIAIIPVVTLGLFLVFYLQVRTEKILIESMTNTIAGIQNNIDHEILNQSLLLEELENNLLSYDLEEDRSKVKTLMHQSLGSKGQHVNLHIISDQKPLNLSTGNIPTHYQLPLYKNWGIFKHAQENETIIYPNEFNNSGKDNILSFIRKTKLEGLDLYIIMDVTSDYFAPIIYSYQKNNQLGTMSIVVADTYDNVIYLDPTLQREIKNTNYNNKINLSLFAEQKLIKSSVSDFNYVIHGLLTQNVLDQQQKTLTIVIVLLLLIVLILSIFISLDLAQSISEPITKLAVETANLDIKNNELLQSDYEIAELELMKEKINDLIRASSRHHQQNLEKNELLKNTQIKALMSQMNPHFLYNTLDVIKWKAKLNEVSDIELLVTNLASLLRSSMRSSDTMIPVQEELDLIENYIIIQKIRYEEKFDFNINVEKNMYQEKIPKFLLQPLVENALIHGIEPKEGKGAIEIIGYMDHKMLYFIVVDDGVGSDVELSAIDYNEHIGLINLDKRIKLYYGDDYGIYWKSKLGIGTRIFIELPREGGR